jgi:hypothetical protein
MMNPLQLGLGPLGLLSHGKYKSVHTVDCPFVSTYGKALMQEVQYPPITLIMSFIKSKLCIEFSYIRFSILQFFERKKIKIFL